MSKMSELILSIQEMAHDMGDDYGDENSTIVTIAQYFQIPEDMVIAALDGFDENIDDDSYDEFNDNMDGDFDSAMASVGFGTDEDYGCFSDDY